MIVDDKIIQALADLLNKNDLSEIEIEEDNQRVRVVRAPAVLATAPPVAAPLVAASSIPPIIAPEKSPYNDEQLIKSPIVGAVYVSPKPGADPFVRVGTAVKKGDTLLIVEAMKIMNPIVAPRDGVVDKIFIDNGSPVEFDEPLMALA
jgi:acetyl-CoA carboxylase biotin carboxyl carrier protein